MLPSALRSCLPNHLAATRLSRDELFNPRVRPPDFKLAAFPLDNTLRYMGGRGGPEYFEAILRGALVPLLTGLSLISCTPERGAIAISPAAGSGHAAVAQPNTPAPPPTATTRPPLVLEIWPGKVPDEPGTIGPERERMSPQLDRKQVEVTESTRMITDVTKPTVTIYRPPADKDTGTAILICPGGGYWNLYWQLEGEEVATWLNSLGVTGIILKYRVPRRPDEPKGEPARRPLQDAQRAVSLVRSKAKDWGIDPQRIGVVGFSAGGHLAIATATHFEKRTYEPVDEIDTISCRPDFAILVYPGYLKAKDKDELAPGLHVPAATPPVFLAHGGEDIVSPPEHSVLMYLALRRAGIPAELHVYAMTAHDFGVRQSAQPCSTWTASCAAWLRHLGFLNTPVPARP
jgi:acetyl esterase/lipase